MASCFGKKKEKPFTCQRTWRSSDHPEGRDPAKSKPQGHHAERAALGSQDYLDFTFYTSVFRAIKEISELRLCILSLISPTWLKKTGKSRSRGEVTTGKISFGAEWDWECLAKFSCSRMSLPCTAPRGGCSRWKRRPQEQKPLYQTFVPKATGTKLLYQTFLPKATRTESFVPNGITGATQRIWGADT